MSDAVSTRLNALVASMESHDLDAVLLNPGSSLPYLSGLHFHISERPVVFALSRAGKVSIVLPELEKQKVTHCPYPISSFTYSEDVTSWQRAFSAGLSFLASGGAKRIGIEPRSLRVLELRLIEASLPDVTLTTCEALVAALREKLAAAEKRPHEYVKVLIEQSASEVAGGTKLVAEAAGKLGAILTGVAKAVAG